MADPELVAEARRELARRELERRGVSVPAATQERTVTSRIRDAAAERFTNPIDDPKPWQEYAAGIMGPAARAGVGSARIIEDLIKRGGDAPLVHEAKKYGGALAGGLAGWANSTADDLASGDGDRLSAAMRDLGIKAFAPTLGPLAPVVRSTSVPEAAQAAASTAGGVGSAGKDFIAGLAETLFKGRIDENRPIGSSGDVAAIGGVVGRALDPKPYAETATPAQARRLQAPRGGAKAMRIKAKHLRAQDRYLEAQKPYYSAQTKLAAAQESKKALQAELARLDAGRAKAIRTSDLNPQLEKARGLMKSAADAHQAADLRATRAEVAGSPDALQLRAAADKARAVANLAAKEFSALKGERAKTIPRQFTRGAFDNKMEQIERANQPIKAAQLEVAKTRTPVKQAVESVRRLEPQMNQSVMSRLAKKLAEQTSTIPTAVKGTPHVLLGEAATVEKIARALMSGSRASSYLSQMLGDVTIAGAEDAMAAAAQIQHLAETDPLVRQLLGMALKE